MKGTGSPTFFRKVAKDFKAISCSSIFFAFAFSYVAFTEATSPSNSEEKNRTQKISVVTCFSFHLFSLMLNHRLLLRHLLEKHWDETEVTPDSFTAVPRVLEAVQQFLAPCKHQGSHHVQLNSFCCLGGRSQTPALWELSQVLLVHIWRHHLCNHRRYKSNGS